MLDVKVYKIYKSRVDVKLIKVYQIITILRPHDSMGLNGDTKNSILYFNSMLFPNNIRNYRVASNKKAPRSGGVLEQSPT